MRGMDEEKNDDPDAMNNKSVPSRMLVIAGGSLMNFLLAFVLFFIMIMARGMPIDEPEIFVAQLTENMPGHEAGLFIGDIITHINNVEIKSPDQIIAMINNSGGNEIQMHVTRDGAPLVFAITPVQHESGERYVVGFVMGGRYIYARTKLHEGIIGSAEMIVFQIRMQFEVLSQMIAGEELDEDVRVVGPLGMGEMFVELVSSIDGVSARFLTSLTFAAVISLMLGIINMLPIPAMDGSRIVFLLVEGIRGKPVPPEKEAMVHVAGFFLIILLAVFILYQDIASLITRFLEP
jgi:regulator of sigma E protease